MNITVCLIVFLAFCCSTSSAAIPVRLVDGAAPSEGRVEIFLNNTWCTICGEYWYSSNAAVVCRQLGYSSGSNARTVNGFFGNPPSSRPMLLYKFSCSGSELNLDACTKDPVSYVYSSQYHAGVVCEPYVHPPMQVRLRDGQISTHVVEGRVEVSSNGTWGTICDNIYSSSPAKILCRMLGYNSSSPYVVYGSLYGSGSGPILITRLQCQYSDTDLSTCLQLNSSNVACPNSQVLGIVCRFSYSSKKNITIRLDGPSPYEGTVELFVYGTWRKLCIEKPNESKAGVICRQLGWNISDAYVGFTASFIPLPTPFSNRVYVHNICSGFESNFGYCTVYAPLGSHRCLLMYELGVSCYPAKTAVTTRELSTEKKVENPETATEKSSGNPSDAGANKRELNVAAVILGTLLVLAVIIIMIILVFFLTRDQLRGASYLADANRGSQQQTGQAPSRETCV